MTARYFIMQLTYDNNVDFVYFIPFSESTALSARLLQEHNDDSDDDEISVTFHLSSVFTRTEVDTVTTAIKLIHDCKEVVITECLCEQFGDMCTKINEIQSLSVLVDGIDVVDENNKYMAIKNLLHNKYMAIFDIDSKMRRHW